VQPTPQLNAAEKAVMHASGMEVMNVRKFENAAYKTTSALTAANASAVLGRRRRWQDGRRRYLRDSADG